MVLKLVIKPDILERFESEIASLGKNTLDLVASNGEALRILELGNVIMADYVITWKLLQNLPP